MASLREKAIVASTNFGAVEASPVRTHHRALSLNLTLPPLAAVLFGR